FRRVLFRSLVGLELDRPVDVVVGLDRLCGVVVPRAVGLVIDQTGEHVVENLTAVDFVGVGWDQRVLRLAPGDVDDAGRCRSSSVVVAAVVRRATGEDKRGGDCDAPGCCCDASDSHGSSCTQCDAMRACARMAVMRATLSLDVATAKPD